MVSGVFERNKHNWKGFGLDFYAPKYLDSKKQVQTKRIQFQIRRIHYRNE